MNLRALGCLVAVCALGCVEEAAVSSESPDATPTDVPDVTAPSTDRGLPAIDVITTPDVETDVTATTDLPAADDVTATTDLPAAIDVTAMTDRPTVTDVPADRPSVTDAASDRPPTDECARYPFAASTLLAERVGYGRAATGGDPTRVYHVNTLSGDSVGTGSSGSLRRALESAEPWWIVFDVNGTITHRTRVEGRSNKTVDGRGRDIHVRGAIRFNDARNVILSDIRLSNDLEGHCTQAGDVLTLNGRGTASPSAFTTRDIWVNHVEIFNGGDGLLDLRGASLVTVSWSHFHTHKKGLLMWRDSAQADTPGMRVTMHHNFFDRITLRGPQFLYGRLHYFNNYQFEWFEYGVGSLGGAQLLSEANVYQARAACLPSCTDRNPCGDTEYLADMTRALVTEWDTNGRGNSRSVNDSLRNGARLSIVNPASVFDARTEYPYTADAADDALVTRVRETSGPRTRYCRP